MLRSWLPRRQLVYHQLHANSLWRSQIAASFLFLDHLHTSAVCTDKLRRLAATVSTDPISTLERKSKGQRKREALRSVEWAGEFATFSDSQLRRAIRWGNLKEEVYDAVRIVKKIGRYGRHARTRQLKLIGGLLRAVDPDLMEAVIKAIKDGDVEGVFKKSGEPNDKDDDDNEEEEEDDSSNVEDNYDNDEEDDDNEDFDSDDQQQSFCSEFDSKEQVEGTVERWFQGLRSGDSDVIAEVFSIRSVNLNRQSFSGHADFTSNFHPSYNLLISWELFPFLAELRRLVRDAFRSRSQIPENNNDDSDEPSQAKPAIVARNHDPQAKLRQYLENLAEHVQNDD